MTRPLPAKNSPIEGGMGHAKPSGSSIPHFVFFRHMPLAHLPLYTLFAPQNFAQALFSISLGKAVIPRRNEKQRLCKILGGK